MRITFDSCSKSPVYLAIRDAAVNTITIKGSFEKNDILKQTGFDVVAASINWNFIRRMIEQEHKTKLLPMAARFFSCPREFRKKFPRDRYPGKYMATGSGKSCAGYAAVTRENGEFVIHDITIKTARANGIHKSVEQEVVIGVQANIDGLEYIKSEPGALNQPE